MFDTAIVQGSSHVKCDDYAIHDDKVAVICDGCSGAKYGDIASRTVAYHMFKYLQEHPDFIITPENIRDIMDDKIPDYAVTDILDTTMLSLNKSDRFIVMMTLGDGYNYVKMTSGISIHKQHTYPGNLPLYVSYLVDPGMLGRFKEQQKEKIISSMYFTNDSIGDSPDSGESEIVPPVSIHRQCKSVNTNNIIAVMTDGIETFDCGKDTAEIVEELMHFPVISPGCMQRRLNKIVKQYGYPSDDLAIGVWINDKRES